MFHLPGRLITGFPGGTEVWGAIVLPGLLVAVLAAMPFIGNWKFIVVKMFQAILLSIIVGTLYYQLPVTSYNNRVALLTFAGGFISMSRLPDVPAVFVRKPIWARHIAARMYPAWLLSIALFVIALPLSIAFCIVFGSILYWLTAFTADAGRFFFFLLVIWSVDLCFLCLFRFASLVLSSMQLVQTIAGAGSGVLQLFAGYIITVGNIPDYGLLAYYVSPYSWCVPCCFVEV